VGDWGEVSERAPDSTWHDYELTLRTYIRGVSALAPDKVFMVGNDGFIYRGPIPGVDRFIPVDKMGQRLFDVDMLDALHGWAVGTNGTILFHNGIGWANQHANVNKDLQGVSALSGSSAWAVGNSGNILHYDGSEWVTQESGTDQDLYDVCALDSSHVWTVGKDTVLFNDGTAWSKDESAKFTAKGISGTGSDFVLAAGGFEIHRYNGTKWEFERLSLHILNDVYAFNQNNTNYAWAVGHKGHALFYNGLPVILSRGICWAFMPAIAITPGRWEQRAPYTNITEEPGRTIPGPPVSISTTSPATMRTISGWRETAASSFTLTARGGSSNTTAQPISWGYQSRAGI
jgi:hypothetical protein